MWLRLKKIINSSALFFWGGGNQSVVTKSANGTNSALDMIHSLEARCPELALDLGEREGKFGLGRGWGGRRTVPVGGEPAGGERGSERVCSGSE